MLLDASFCQQATATMSAYKFSPVAVASPDAPQKPLVRKRARSGGVKWVQVSRDEPGQKAKKSGYSETIAWRKVRLTKQRNVDLTTDGLWAMPLNTGWVPVKARRLQDWENLKNMFQFTTRGMCAPMGSLPLVEGGNNEDDSDSE